MCSVQLRHLKASDETVFMGHIRRSRELHRRWVKVPTSAKAFQRYIKEMNTAEDQAYVAIRTDTQEMVGVVELQDIFRGDFQNAYLIYYGFAGQLKQGLMRQAVQHVIAKAFGSFKLHRLEANIQPDNFSSIALIKACGFEKEGLSRHFLRKNGEWRDHERWSLLNEPPPLDE
ncbi:MAG: N-acetyltransferase [Betaproteobacteria bacterium]|nr:N-acetyltransferase [Betaproteobacteria bacterium]